MPSSAMCRTSNPCLWWMIALFVGLILLSSDIWTKYLAHDYFTTGVQPAGDISIWHDWAGIDFAITYVPNWGAAWGWLAEWQHPLLILRILTVASLLFYIGYTQPPPAKLLAILLVAIGAMGNIIDNFLYGYVIDIFLFTFWGHEFAVFNIADSAITIGIIILILQTYWEERYKTYA